MSDESERLKKKNLLLSYYNAQGNDLGASGDSISNNKTTQSSSSLTTSNLTNSSFNSNSEYAPQASSNGTLSNNIQIHLKDPYDINSTMFEPDLYLKRLIKVFIL